MSDELNKILNIKLTEVVDNNDSLIIVPEDGVAEDVDFDFVRLNHYVLAKQASDAMDIAMKVARESQDPKAIDALSKLLKASSELSRQLLLLSKDKGEVKNVKGSIQKPTGTNIHANNVVFAGTSSDLSKILNGS